jgi:hypothetical protein
LFFGYAAQNLLIGLVGFVEDFLRRCSELRAPTLRRQDLVKNQFYVALNAVDPGL